MKSTFAIVLTFTIAGCCATAPAPTQPAQRETQTQDKIPTQILTFVPPPANEQLSRWDIELPANRTTAIALEKDFGDFPDQQITFEKFLAIFSQRTGLILRPNWKVIEATIPKNCVGRLQLKNSTARSALIVALEEYSGGQATPLTYALDEGAIVICTDDYIRNTTLHGRTYDVADILATTTREQLLRTIAKVAQFDSIDSELIDSDAPDEFAPNLRGTSQFFGDRLMIYDCVQFHNKVASLLNSIRHPAPK